MLIVLLLIVIVALGVILVRRVEGRLHPLLPAFEECTNQIYAITNPDAPAFPARDRFVDELFSA